MRLTISYLSRLVSRGVARQVTRAAEGGSNSGPLRGIRVVELAGLAAAPHLGLILADFGADVIRVDRKEDHVHYGTAVLGRGKRSMKLDLKCEGDRETFFSLVDGADVVIEPFRPGVMERLGAGPDVLMKRNPRLIFARLTGWGQSGVLARTAGHDINYLAVSGVLSCCARNGQRPVPPVNLLGDFAGGSLTCAFGITAALFERERSGQGQIIDSAFIDGAAYLSTFLFRLRGLGMWGEAGTNIIDTGAPYYDTYTCADGRYVAVGAIEPKFYSAMLEGLGLDEDALPAQNDRSKWALLRETLTSAFAKKDRDEWVKVFEGHPDACVSPVLSLDEAPLAEHNITRGSFVRDCCGPSVESEDRKGFSVPEPGPRLSRTPARSAHGHVAPELEDCVLSRGSGWPERGKSP